MSAAFDLTASLDVARREPPLDSRTIAPGDWWVLDDLIPVIELRDTFRRADPLRLVPPAPERPAFALGFEWWKQWIGSPIDWLRAEDPPPANGFLTCRCRPVETDVVDEPRRPLRDGPYGARKPGEPSRYGSLPKIEEPSQVYGPKPGPPDQAKRRSPSREGREHFTACERAMRRACSKFRVRGACEELTQALAEELLRYVKAKGEPDNLEAWCVEYAKRRVFNYLRNERTRRDAESDTNLAYRRTGPAWQPAYFPPTEGALSGARFAEGGAWIMSCKGGAMGGPASEVGEDPPRRPERLQDVEGLLVEAFDIDKQAPRNNNKMAHKQKPTAALRTGGSLYVKGS